MDKQYFQNGCRFSFRKSTNVGRLIRMFFKFPNNKIVQSTREFYALGTVIQFKAYGKKADKVCDMAMDKINEIENNMSVFKGNSEVSTINKNAGIGQVKVSRGTYYVNKKAVEYGRMSKGAFDPTIRPVVGLWGIQTENPRIPNTDEINRNNRLVNYKDIILDEQNHTVMLRNKDQALDLGAIAKGFAADEVKNIFCKHKIKSALIDLGGNIFALGNKPNDTPWKIGIQDPFKKRGEFIGVICVTGRSIVTSGNYERYFMNNDKRFHHIMDPFTGNPSENGVISATIISDYSIDGDALSTCAFVMGIEAGLKLAESIEGVDALFITENKKIYTTCGIDNELEVTSKEFLRGPIKWK